jgi:DNA-directed RNA polymerase specialized sigma24 family protein
LSLAVAEGRTAQLAAALRVQDPSVATALWRRYAPVVSRILRLTLGPQDRIDDSVQVVLLCVFHCARLLGPRADLDRLILATTVRIAQAELRGRRPRPLPRAATERHRGAGRANPRRDEVLRFYRILDGLSGADRVAFVMHYVEGLDGRAVAEIMGSSPALAKRRFRRSLRKVSAGIESDPVLSRLRTG